MTVLSPLFVAAPRLIEAIFVALVCNSAMLLYISITVSVTDIALTCGVAIVDTILAAATLDTATL